MDNLTPEQRHGLALHQLRQESVQLMPAFYRIRCSCGAESPVYRHRSKADGWKATQFVIRHGAQVAANLRIPGIKIPRPS